MPLEQRVGYKPDHKSFGEFILSEQARKPAIEAAQDIQALVRSRVTKRTGHQAESYKVNEHPAPVSVGGNPRATADVYSDDPAALADEFGNAKRRNPGRPLGKAGAIIGELRGEPG